MKITPLEIRQKTFEKKLRGYDKDEVNAFLQSLSQEWERMIDISKEMKFKLETTEREVSKLREVESSLFKTLKTAEDTGANMIQQANKTAELHLRETQMSADGLLNEAKAKSKAIIEDANDRSRKTLEQAEEKLKDLFSVYKNLEEHRDNLASDIKHLAGDALNKVEKIFSRAKEFDLDKALDSVKEKQKVSERVVESRPNNASVLTPLEKPVEKSDKSKSKKSSSFFDEIE